MQRIDSAPAGVAVPAFTDPVSAGVPAPASDAYEMASVWDVVGIDPATIFLVRVSGDSMRDADILPGDVVVVERDKMPKDGAIVVAAVNGCTTIKRLRRKGASVFLMPANPAYSEITLLPSDSLTLFGVVRIVIRTVAALLCVPVLF